MTFREWFHDMGDAGDPPTLVSIALFAAVFLPTIFFVGRADEAVVWLQDAVGTLSPAFQVTGLTVVILAAMALARIITLLSRRAPDGDS